MTFITRFLKARGFILRYNQVLHYGVLEYFQIRFVFQPHVETEKRL